MNALPRALADWAPLPGTIKSNLDDFIVEELPLYPFSGEGEHTLAHIEKRGISTQLAARELAERLRVSRGDIGIAGLKDSQAVTRQWISILGTTPEAVRAIDSPKIRILAATRHGNKLRRGHLIGNRFIIKVRGSIVPDLTRLRAALMQLSQRGVPNYFGLQRFGVAGSNWRVGHAIARGDSEATVRAILGEGNDPALRGRIRDARVAYDEGRFDDAIPLWPKSFLIERRMLKTIARGGTISRAVRGIDVRSREFYINAFQSHLFNLICAQRVVDSTFCRLIDGDLAWRHDNDAVFRVEAVDAEQPRAERFEVSPSGPLFGRRMTRPEGAAAAIEQSVASKFALSDETWNRADFRHLGGRRPLRFRPADATIDMGEDSRGPFVELRLSLPSGSYATVLLRELFSDPSLEASTDGE